MRYEDFVAAPREMLGWLFEWLELTPVVVHASVEDRINERYLGRFAPGANPLKHVRAIALRQRFDPRISAFGYSLHVDAPLGPVSAPVAVHLIQAKAADTRN